MFAKLLKRMYSKLRLKANVTVAGYIVPDRSFALALRHNFNFDIVCLEKHGLIVKADDPTE